jgi:uncharacterized protein
MDWTVYWFQSIACFLFASAAMFSGITGAGLMFPWFLMGFPLLGVPEIDTEQAIASSLFLESAAFAIGIYRYATRRLIDTATVKKLAWLVVPAGVAGAVASHWAPDRPLRLAYSLMMLVAAGMIVRSLTAGRETRHDRCAEGEPRELGRGDEQHRFCAHGLRGQQGVTAGGGFMTGLISTGVGEVTSPLLIVRSGFPVAVAAATSIVLVAVANLSASLTHLVQFAATRGLADIPWNLIVWGVPGMAAGALLGSHLQGRVSERRAKAFFAALFIVISLAFLGYTFTGDA